MIYFLTPDATRPSGGPRQIYLMVDLLRELGREASVFHGEPGFRCTWFENDTPVVSQPFLRLDRGDVLVVPEYDGARQHPRCADASVVIFNQGHYRTFINAGFDDRLPGAYPGWPNAKAVLYTSDAIQRFLSIAVRDPLPMYRTRVVVDTERFLPRPKQRRIALMTRKRAHEAESVVQLVYRCGVDWEICPIGQIAHIDVATTLGEAAIFLSFSSGEGFGLPPAEAMAAGCYVVGYSGDGGREYMDPQWCSPIRDEDLVGFAEEVVRVARWWDDDPNDVQRVAEKGRGFVTATYTRENLRADLDVAFTALTAPGSDALQREPVEVTHWSVPVGPRGRLVRARRSIARRLQSHR